MCVAVPGYLERVIEEGGARLGEVRFGDTVRRVDLVLVPEARAGDHLIVHSGLAVRRLDAAEAAATRELLDEAFGGGVESEGGQPG